VLVPILPHPILTLYHQYCCIPKRDPLPQLNIHLHLLPRAEPPPQYESEIGGVSEVEVLVEEGEVVGEGEVLGVLEGRVGEGWEGGGVELEEGVEGGEGRAGVEEVEGFKGVEGGGGDVAVVHEYCYSL